MSIIRQTNCDKWHDRWFSSLSPNAKLLFFFLCENCDNAGFYEINKKLLLTMLGVNIEELIAAIKEINKCYVLSNDRRTIWIKNFLKHQSKIPLNERNNNHKNVIRIIESKIYDLDKFHGNKHVLSILPRELLLKVIEHQKKIELIDNPELAIKTEQENLSSEKAESKRQETKPKRAKKFIPPTMEEIEDYMLTKGYKDAKRQSELYFNFYTSKNWMVGKNKMANWKSAANNWMTTNSPSNTNTSTRTEKPSKVSVVQESFQDLANNDWTENYKKQD